MTMNRLWKLFECKRCGHCCAGIEPPYDKESIFEIAKYLEISVDEAVWKYYYGTLIDNGKNRCMKRRFLGALVSQRPRNSLTIIYRKRRCVMVS